MKIKTDLHCHSIVSNHAFSTIMENITYAASSGLEAIAITDHSPALGDAPHKFYYPSFVRLPDSVNGVRFLKGCEVNILNNEGELDLDNKILSTMDIVIASVHNPFYRDAREDGDNTDMYIKVLQNPYVDILGHSGNPKCKFDIEKVLTKAKELGKFIEINENTFAARPQNVKICKQIALCAKRIGTYVVVNSDAHFCTNVGVLTNSIKMLEEIDFPEGLIANSSYGRLKELLKSRKNI